MTTSKTKQILQEVIGGCFVWEETSKGWIRVDFYDSIYLAQEAYPEATTDPLPPTLITDLESA
jgi:hypothetical protein